MGFRAAFLVLVLALAGCVVDKFTPQKPPTYPEITYRVYLDPGFPLSEKVIIKDALKDWKHALGGYIDWKYLEEIPKKRDGRILVITRAQSTDSNVRFKAWMNTKPDFMLLAWQSIDDGVLTIFIIEDLIRSEYYYRKIVRHEIGHVLGLDHCPRSAYSLMQERIDYASECPSKLDVEKACQKLGCSLTYTSPCD